MKLRKIFILIILIITLTSLTKKKYFEGVITYNVETIILKESSYSDYLKERYGTSMKFYWGENGNLLRKTFGNQAGLDYSLYIQKENTFYVKYKGVDTLYYYSGLTQDNELLQTIEDESEPILNQKCKKIELKLKSKFDGKEFISEYHYSKNQKINYKLYQNLNDGFANIIYKTTKSPYLKLKLIFDEIIMTYKAEKIEEIELDENIFKIDNKLPRKKHL
ncbi:hypothetical protein [Aureivirga sp. CE67]|uniref:hypothetical protein n=1 Tax=Aureivirga sp. CE67 TaxID=1788983 RepID=UPI0018CAF9E5|nr:hypothetical protein [Aureivirga sp. CE67]